MAHQLAYTKEFVKLAPKGALRAFYELYKSCENEGRIGDFCIKKQDGNKFPGQNHENIWIASGEGRSFFIKEADGEKYDCYSSFILLQNMGMRIKVKNVEVVGSYLGYTDNYRSFIVMDYLSPDKFELLGEKTRENSHLHNALGKFKARALNLFGADDMGLNHVFREIGKDRIVLIDPIGAGLRLGETLPGELRKLAEGFMECRKYTSINSIIELLK